MATQDYDSDFDTDTDTYTPTPSKMGRAKDAIKEGLSDVQQRFESSNMNLNWKKILPVALVGTLGAIVYSRRGKGSHLNTHSRSKGGKMAHPHNKHATGSKGTSHRGQA